jgi:hypothetical protein
LATAEIRDRVYSSSNVAALPLEERGLQFEVENAFGGDLQPPQGFAQWAAMPLRRQSVRKSRGTFTADERLGRNGTLALSITRRVQEREDGAIAG